MNAPYTKSEMHAIPLGRKVFTEGAAHPCGTASPSHAAPSQKEYAAATADHILTSRPPTAWARPATSGSSVPATEEVGSLSAVAHPKQLVGSAQMLLYG